MKARSIAQQIVEMPANAFKGSTARPDKILNQKGSLNTATLRQELQNGLGANSCLDLFVFFRLAADTTAEFLHRCRCDAQRHILSELKCGDV